MKEKQQNHTIMNHMLKHKSRITLDSGTNK